jgi:hypothetical protein
MDDLFKLLYDIVVNVVTVVDDDDDDDNNCNITSFFFITPTWFSPANILGPMPRDGQ